MLDLAGAARSRAWFDDDNRYILRFVEIDETDSEACRSPLVGSHVVPIVRSRKSVTAAVKASLLSPATM